MRVETVTLRDFRNYHDAHVQLGEGLTVVTGLNGAGKTNLLEGLYFGCTGRSCRTVNERDVIHFGASSTRVVIGAVGEDGPHELSVGFLPGQPKRLRVDGTPVERIVAVSERPLVSVFLPDRLELIKGAPVLRRAHIDQLIAALWPARAETRRAYAQALAQRNALLARIRSGRASREGLSSWDLQLARHGVVLAQDRAGAVQAISEPFGRLATMIGLGDDASIVYRPRSAAAEPGELAEELAQRRDRDLNRGFTTHGPHRDELAISLAGRELRSYGSQGQQRQAVLALLLAEREAVAASREAPPLMLLDDVMSELDRDRRQALIDVLRDEVGQAVLTTTDLEHVPGAMLDGVSRLAVSAGRILEEAMA